MNLIKFKSVKILFNDISFSMSLHIQRVINEEAGWLT